jgi:succinoglycan biosynthesis protein ExoM
MLATRPHISVCVCTYNRPGHLERLLDALQAQDADGAFSCSVVVVDNDHRRSAQRIVQRKASQSRIPISYHVEPEQNIALARNKAIANATGDFIAFIDDDEIPSPRWLRTLYEALVADADAAGVLGPVIPQYESPPPRWVVRGRFYERPSHATGEVLHWTNTRTGNVLLRRALFAPGQKSFRPEFGSGGEDRDFFRRMTAAGHRFVWCAEAPVYEAVPAHRCTRSFMLRRALLRGQLPHFTAGHVAQSLVAVPLYTAALPMFWLLAHHLFMRYLIKACDHLGRIFAYCGIKLVKEKYIV